MQHLEHQSIDRIPIQSSYRPDGWADGQVKPSQTWSRRLLENSVDIPLKGNISHEAGYVSTTLNDMAAKDEVL